MFNNKIKKLFLHQKKPVIYMSISILATSLDIGIFLILTSNLHFYYIISATISYITSVITKFTLNKIFVFSNRPGVWKTQLTKFTTVSLNGLILTNIFMYIGVDIFTISYFYTKLITIGIIFIYTASLHNFFSFSNKRL